MKRERGAAFIIGSTVLLVTLLPQVAAWHLARSTPFAAVQVGELSRSDTPVYYSYIEQARQGRVLFKNLYTTMPQHPRLVFPLWFALGRIADVTSLPTPAAYHLARLVANALLVLLVWRLTTRLLPAGGWRVVGFLMVLFSSGLGALVAGLPNLDDPAGVDPSRLPTDLWLPEGNTFLTTLATPLFPLSQAMVLGALWLFHDGQGFDWRWWLAAGALVFLSVSHTYDLVIVAVVLGGWFLARLLTNMFPDVLSARRFLIRASLLFLPAAVGVGYFLWVLATEPAVRGWVDQNVTVSPSPVYYLLGYGLLLPLAWIGGRAVFRRRDSLGMLLAVWAAAAFLLAYAPLLDIQRRLVNGVHLPLAMLATIGLRAIGKYCQMRWPHPTARPLLVAGGVLVGSLLISSNIALGVKTIEREFRGRPIDGYARVPDAFLRAADWLRERSTIADGLFSTHAYANLLAGFTGRHVVIGHGHQTPRWAEEWTAYQAFLESRWTPEEEQRYLRDRRATYFVWVAGQPEFAQFDPASRPYLSPVFRDDGVVVYRVSARESLL